MKTSSRELLPTGAAAVRGALLPLLLTLLLSGCANQFRVKVESDPRTNDGELVYVLVRNVSPDMFDVESYEDVARLAMTGHPTILAARKVKPGETTTIPVASDLSTVAVYAMFTDPGNRWRVQLDIPWTRIAKVVMGRREFAPVVRVKSPDPTGAAGAAGAAGAPPPPAP